MEATSRVIRDIRQHKQKVAFGHGGREYPRNFKNFREVGEFLYSRVQVDNPVSVTGGLPNTVRIVTPKNVFSHTDSTT